jgi:hypothetical protein
MSAARQLDRVRTKADAESVFDGRTVPVGVEGTVLEARADGTCVAEVALTPQIGSGGDGDFVLIVLAQDQYEVLQG